MTEKRSGGRGAPYLFQMSVEDRAELKRRAEAEGTTMRGYLERVVFGYSGEPQPKGPQPKRTNQSVLDGFDEAQPMRRTS